MSKDVRRTVMYWVTLVFGIAILMMQMYKYFTGKLELTIEEGCVSAFAVVLMVNPHLISDLFVRIINAKEGNNDGKQV